MNNFDKYRNWLLALSILAGAFLANSTILAPLHEIGHYSYALNNDNQDAVITSWNTTALSRLSMGAVLAGYHYEIATFLVLYIVLFFFTSNKSIGIRRHYWYLGLPLGYATWSWLNPIINPVSDMTVAPELTATMRAELFSDYFIFLCVAWVILFITRVLPSRSSQ